MTKEDTPWARLRSGVVVDKDNLKGIVDFGGMGGASFTAKRQATR